MLKPRLIKSEGLTLVGLKGNQDNMVVHSEKIEGMLSEIRNISIPYYCQVVWSVNHAESVYDIFQGLVVSEAEIISPGLEVYISTHPKYVAFEQTGDAASFVKFLEGIHGEWLPNSGYEFAGNDFSHIQFTKTAQSETDLTISLDRRVFTREIWFPVE